jgi:hypothetical protein
MGYDPFERRHSAREIIAAWIICLSIAGLGLGLTAGHEAPAAPALPMLVTHAGRVSGSSVDAFPGAAEAARFMAGSLNSWRFLKGA